jgi:hypothetical protein
MDVEIWPTNVVIDAGGKLELEIAAGDNDATARFSHNHPQDRAPEKFRGQNNIHLGPSFQNYLIIPVIPSATL